MELDINQYELQCCRQGLLQEDADGKLLWCMLLVVLKRRSWLQVNHSTFIKSLTKIVKKSCTGFFFFLEARSRLTSSCCQRGTTTWFEPDSCVQACKQLSPGPLILSVGEQVTERSLSCFSFFFFLQLNKPTAANNKVRRTISSCCSSLCWCCARSTLSRLFNTVLSPLGCIDFIIKHRVCFGDAKWK